MCPPCHSLIRFAIHGAIARAAIAEFLAQKERQRFLAAFVAEATANLNPAHGREIGKIRPVLIVQADELIDADTPMVVVLPLTTHVYPQFRLWRVTVQPRGVRSNSHR